MALQGDAEGSKEGLGWRGLLEGVGQQVNSQLMQALEGSQRLLGQRPQVTQPAASCCVHHCQPSRVWPLSILRLLPLSLANMRQVSRHHILPRVCELHSENLCFLGTAPQELPTSGSVQMSIWHGALSVLLLPELQAMMSLLSSTSRTHTCTDAKVANEAFAVEATSAFAQQMSASILHHPTYVMHMLALHLLPVHNAVVLCRIAGIALLLLLVQLTLCTFLCFLQNSTNDTTDDYSGSSSSQDYRGLSPLHRAGELQPFIQEQCSEAVQAMAEQLQAQLLQLGQPAMDLQGAQLVEQALLLGTRQISHAMPLVLL